MELTTKVGMGEWEEADIADVRVVYGSCNFSVENFVGSFFSLTL